jgi:hypothetical protein
MIRKLLRFLVYRKIKFVQVRPVVFQPRLCIQMVLRIGFLASTNGLRASMVDIRPAEESVQTRLETCHGKQHCRNTSSAVGTPAIRLCPLMQRSEQSTAPAPSPPRITTSSHSTDRLLVGSSRSCVGCSCWFWHPKSLPLMPLAFNNSLSANSLV